MWGKSAIMEDEADRWLTQGFTLSLTLFYGRLSGGGGPIAEPLKASDCIFPSIFQES